MPTCQYRASADVAGVVKSSGPAALQRGQTVSTEDPEDRGALPSFVSRGVDGVFRLFLRPSVRPSADRTPISPAVPR